MDQLKQLLASLSNRQRITILVAAILVGAGIMLFSRWRKESDFRPLYTGLASEDAGAVVQKLRESGTDYRLSAGGDAVLVSSAKLAETRLEMAAAGLPKTGRIGFELFDKTSFGATEFVEQINYKRALEGELERSVMCLAEVDQSRVHITFPKDSLYLDSRQPAKASVMVHLRTGAQLAPQNVQAISQLVSSAVEGLSPDSVSVMDMRGNLLARGRKSLASDGEYSGEMLEFQQQIEKSLVAKVNATLEPLLGAERFRTSASVECDFAAGQLSEETYDPNKSVMLTSQTVGGHYRWRRGFRFGGRSGYGVGPTEPRSPRRLGAGGHDAKNRKCDLPVEPRGPPDEHPEGHGETCFPRGAGGSEPELAEGGSEDRPGSGGAFARNHQDHPRCRHRRGGTEDRTWRPADGGEPPFRIHPQFRATRAVDCRADPGGRFLAEHKPEQELSHARRCGRASAAVCARPIRAALPGRRKKRILVVEQPALAQAPGAAQALQAGLSSVPQLYQAAQRSALPATGAELAGEDSLVVQIRDSVRQNSDLTVSVVRNWLNRPEEGVPR